MRVRACSVLSLAALLCVASQYAAAERPTPVIVELFTSEGCSSCPPADAVLAKLHRVQPIPGVEIIALGEHVDYWDRLGWEDRFSDPQFTERQQSYGPLWPLRFYTPQMVVDGQSEFVGSDWKRALKEIAKAAERQKAQITIRFVTPRSLRIELDPFLAGLQAEVYIAVVEDGLSTEVERGENEGRMLPHAPVVRNLEKAGSATDEGFVAASLILDESWQRERLSVVTFAQEPNSRRIVAAARIALETH